METPLGLVIWPYSQIAALQCMQFVLKATEMILKLWMMLKSPYKKAKSTKPNFKTRLTLLIFVTQAGHSQEERILYASGLNLIAS